MSTPEIENLGIENLEQRAAEERELLQKRATELKSKVEYVRQNLDITRSARRHFGATAGILAAVGLLAGYAVAGLFTDH